MRYVLPKALLCSIVAIACGCADRASMMPNPDVNLRKDRTVFAAEAVKCHPFKSDAPRGGEAVARAEVDYAIDKVEIINLSDAEWDNVEVWANEKYVVIVPVMQPKVLKKLDFEMLFDDQGQSFPTKKTMIEKIEIYRDGKMYDVKVRPAD